MELIKFRGKLKTPNKDGKLIIGDLLQLEFATYIIPSGSNFYKAYLYDEEAMEVDVLSAIEVFQDTVGQFTGAKTAKGDKVYPGTVAFKEIETDLHDIRIYFVCTWIEELLQFKWLANVDYIDYKGGGRNAIETGFYCDMTESKNYHHAGNIFDNQELLHK